MSDRTSAGIFGDIFDLLANNPNKQNKELSTMIYKQTFQYDFNTYQMGCDGALLILGLAILKGDEVVYNEVEI